MGDRGNVKIVMDAGEPIYLYTHWGGYGLPGTVRAGLIRARGDGLPWANASRFDDGPYLARCIFQEMVGDDAANTGFGISTKVLDNEYPIIVLDSTTQTVSTEGDQYHPATGKSCSMEDYASAEDYPALIGWDSDE